MTKREQAHNLFILIQALPESERAEYACIQYDLFSALEYFTKARNTYGMLDRRKIRNRQYSRGVRLFARAERHHQRNNDS